MSARSGSRIFGVQGAETSRFSMLRTPDTFSWLTPSAQGSGVGTVMRQMICALLFDELDAHAIGSHRQPSPAIASGAYAGNPASAAVSRKVGVARAEDA